MKKIMILGASLLQVPAIKMAKEMGLRVIAVDMNPNAVGFEYADICIEESTIDITKVIDVAKAFKIDGIMTLATDMPMRTIAAVSEELELPGISKQTALQATDKAVMREALFRGNVPIPIFRKVNNVTDFIDAVSSFSRKKMKCISKPVDSAGSRGVKLIEFSDTQDLAEIFEYSKTNSKSGSVLVEEYMEGPEVSVETISINGQCHVIQITDKHTTGPPYFVEYAHSQPSVLNMDTQEKIGRVAVAANKAIGIENGPSHTEIKITSDGPKIVEIGARLGGGNIATHLIPLSSGVNVVGICIKLAMGERIITDELLHTIKKAAVVKFLHEKNGTIKSIEGVENAREVLGVKEVSILKQPGEISRDTNNATYRQGYIVVQSHSIDNAFEICNKAEKLITITID